MAVCISYPNIATDCRPRITSTPSAFHIRKVSLEKPSAMWFDAVSSSHQPSRVAMSVPSSVSDQLIELIGPGRYIARIDPGGSVSPIATSSA